MPLSSSVAEQPRRILIVDDNSDNRELIGIILRPEGFLLSNADSGEHALIVVAREPPELILLDLMMPGMDGYEVARRLKSNPFTQHIPIVMITGLDDGNTRRLALGAGAADLLAKPIGRAELLFRVRRWLPAASRRATRV